MDSTVTASWNQDDPKIAEVVELSVRRMDDVITAAFTEVRMSRACHAAIVGSDFVNSCGQGHHIVVENSAQLRFGGARLSWAFGLGWMDENHWIV